MLHIFTYVPYLFHLQICLDHTPCQGLSKYPIHPGRLTWNLKMMVWKIIFLFNWVVFRFHVNLPGCSRFVFFGMKIMCRLRPFPETIPNPSLTGFFNGQEGLRGLIFSYEIHLRGLQTILKSMYMHKNKYL